MALRPAGSPISPPAITRGADGSAAGTGDVPLDEFAKSLERSTPEEFREQPADEVTEEASDAAPAVKPASTEKPVEEKPTDAAPKDEAPAAPAVSKKDEKAAKAAAKAEEKAAAAKAVAAKDAAAVLDPGEKFVVSRDGEKSTEFSRAQIGNMVRQYPELYAAANETARFRSTFGKIEDAEKNLKPLLDKLNADKKFNQYVSATLSAYGDMESDPEFASYMQRAIDHYRAEATGAQPAPQAGVDRETTERLARLERQNLENANARAQADLSSYIQNEVRSLTATDPRLSDPEILDVVWQHAMIKSQADPTYTLTRAATDLESRIQRLWLSSPSNRAPEPVKPAIPTLVGAGGASPRGTQEQNQPDLAPRQFNNLDEATADWKKVRASLGFGT